MSNQPDGKQEITDNSKQWDFSIFDLYDDGESLWFTAIEYNALLSMDKQTGETTFIGSFPNEDTFGWRLYTTINEHQGKLYFTPGSAHEIGVYDIRNNKFEKIFIGISRKENDCSKVIYSKKFVSGYIHNHTLTLIPCCYNRTIFYDIATQRVSEDHKMFQFFYKKYSSHITSADAQFYLCWLAKRTGTSEIAFQLQSNLNVVVFYHLETRKFREQRVGLEKRTFTMIEYDGTYLWFYDAAADTLIRWEEETDQSVELSISGQIKQFKPWGLQHSFVNMILLGKWLYVIPAYTNFAVKVNTITLEMKKEDRLSAECLIPGEGSAYSSLRRISGDKLYLFGCRSRTLLEVGINGNVREVAVQGVNNIGKILKQNHLMDLMQNGHQVFTEGFFSLSQFLNGVNCAALDHQEGADGGKQPAAVNIGAAIYDYITKEL